MHVSNCSAGDACLVSAYPTTWFGDKGNGSLDEMRSKTPDMHTNTNTWRLSTDLEFRGSHSLVKSGQADLGAACRLMRNLWQARLAGLPDTTRTRYFASPAGRHVQAVQFSVCRLKTSSRIPTASVDHKN